MFEIEENVLVAYNSNEETVVIPEGVKRIALCAFFGCDAVKNIIIPKSVIKIDEGAMNFPLNLESITVHEDNLSYTSLDGVLYTKNKNEIIKCPPNKNSTEIILPKEVEKIYDNAFNSCVALKSLEIPSNVKEIGDGAFFSCQGLTDIKLPSTIEVIGINTFFYCTSLKSVEIPNSVKLICRGAFHNCESLNEIKLPKDCECQPSWKDSCPADVIFY